MYASKPNLRPWTLEPNPIATWDGHPAFRPKPTVGNLHNQAGLRPSLLVDRPRPQDSEVGSQIPTEVSMIGRKAFIKANTLSREASFSENFQCLIAL